MNKLTTMTAAAALALGMGHGGAAFADEFADAVAVDNINNASCGGNCSGSATDTLGPTNNVGASLGNAGSVTVNFTDNTCFIGGGPDVALVDFGGASEDFTVDVGLIGGALSGSPQAGTGDASVDLSPTGLSVFNQAKISDAGTSGQSGGFTGYDADSIQCLSTLDVVDIVKATIDHPDDDGTGDSTDDKNTINIGVDGQQFKAFTIEITNNTGVEFGLAGLTFMDTVPAEFDTDAEAEDLEDSNVNDCSDTDGVCDGVFVSDEPTNGDCTASAVEHQSQGNGNKLKPEFITITAGGLDDGESCEITVFVQTDSDHPGQGKAHKNNNGRGNPDFTPTSCPSDGVIVLNDGVKVIDDATGAVILSDDDSLFLVCATSLLAFLTSTVSDGDLGGLAGADATCQGLADGQSLGGTYIAWLSDSNTDAKDRFDPAFASLPYLRTNDGATIVDDLADLIDGSLDNAINGTETGGTIGAPNNPWTGTGGDGELDATGFTCQDWGSDSSDDDGRAGRHVDFGDPRWTTQVTRTCNSSLRLYCFQKNTF